MKLSCAGARTLHTIGHSTRSIEDFIELLNAHDVELLVDVRRWPASKRFPHFRQEPLATHLEEHGIMYIWREDLGGFRKPSPDSLNKAWKTGAFRAYADFMLTTEFETIMAEMETVAGKARATIMCAEAVPWRCHRQLLADAFLVRGWIVRHILDDGCHEHRLPPFARPEGQRIFYLPSSAS